jgi:hypothetical protein
MKQYCHLLIPSDPEFVPESTEVEKFFNLLGDSFRFQIVLSPPVQPGFMLLTPSEAPRIIRNAFTGETMSVPSFDRTILKDAADVPQAIKDQRHWTVRLSGKWPPGQAPIKLNTPDQAQFEGEPACFVECNLRPETVCISNCNYWDESRPEQAQLRFDDPNGRKLPVGIFINPWNMETIQVPGAGFARFWVSLEFGKWLFPDLATGFNLLQPQLLDAVEQCFGVHFIQAGRGMY